jgi:hypothetical protein
MHRRRRGRAAGGARGHVAKPLPHHLSPTTVRQENPTLARLDPLCPSQDRRRLRPERHGTPLRMTKRGSASRLRLARLRSGQASRAAARLQADASGHGPPPPGAAAGEDACAPRNGPPAPPPPHPRQASGWRHGGAPTHGGGGGWDAGVLVLGGARGHPGAEGADDFAVFQDLHPDLCREALECLLIVEVAGAAEDG